MCNWARGSLILAGLLLPVQYPTGPQSRHLRVRQRGDCSILTTMGQVEVRGPDAFAFSPKVMTADVSAIPLEKRAVFADVL
jgi:glycine cleavage system aminomethyltransferase T